MVDPELTRRKILSGMAVAGTAGALVGSGTVSLFSDEEASNVSFTGGVVKLDVDGTVEVNSNDVKDGVELTITLPELTATPDTQNNPAWVWIRTAACPESIEDAMLIDVDVLFNGSVIVEGSLFDVLTGELRTGTLLTTHECLQPGESGTLSIRQTNTGQLPDDIGPVEIKLQVFAEQCRHNSEPEPPFDPVIGKDECEIQGAGGKSLSFVSFCVAGDVSSFSKPEFTTMASDEDGPTSVMWDTGEINEEIEFVVAKAGNEITIYDYTGSDPTKGIVETGGDGDADFVESFSNIGSLNPKPTSAPCEFAVDKLDVNESEVTPLEPFKYEPQGDGTWELVS